MSKVNDYYLKCLEEEEANGTFDSPFHPMNNDVDPEELDQSVSWFFVTSKIITSEGKHIPIGEIKLTLDTERGYDVSMPCGQYGDESEFPPVIPDDVNEIKVPIIQPLEYIHIEVALDDFDGSNPKCECGIASIYRDHHAQMHYRGCPLSNKK